MSDTLQPHGLLALQASMSITNSWSSLKLMPIELVMPSYHRPLSVPFSSRLRAFSNESALRIRWPKYWSFSFNISLSSAFSGLISFRLDWLDLLAVQGTLRSLLQHCSSVYLTPLSLFYSFIKDLLLKIFRSEIKSEIK